MLHRTGKACDINEGKWIGVGGKFSSGESPEECLLREVFEETGYRLRSWRFRGFITFIQEGTEPEYMCLYTADDFEVKTAGRWIRASLALASDYPCNWAVPDCDEGRLAWIPTEEVMDLELWPGDRIFLELLRSRDEFFSLKLFYKGNELLEAALDGEVL